MTGQMKAGFLGLGLAAVVLAGVAFAQDEKTDKVEVPPPEDMTFEWTVPSGGTTPVNYEVEIRKGGSNSTVIETRMVATNRVTFAIKWLTLYEVRARGIDDQGRIGPWSIWSLAEDEDHTEPGF